MKRDSDGGKKVLQRTRYGMPRSESAVNCTGGLVAFTDIMQGMRYLFEPQGEEGKNHRSTQEMAEQC